MATATHLSCRQILNNWVHSFREGKRPIVVYSEASRVDGDSEHEMVWTISCKVDHETISIAIFETAEGSSKDKAKEACARQVCVALGVPIPARVPTARGPITGAVAASLGRAAEDSDDGGERDMELESSSSDMRLSD